MKKYLPVILLLLLVFIAGWIQHDDSDLYGHFAMGRVIAQQGIPHHEVMSQAGPSRLYIPTEWLFQIILYWFLTVFGFSSYHLFNALFTVVNIFALYILLKRIFKLNELFSLLLSASYGILNYQFFVPRPQIFADTFLLLELFILFKYLLQNENYLFWLIPILFVWTNIHASFFVGILMGVAYIFICIFKAFMDDRKVWLKKAGILSLYTFGMIIASILPPQGFGEYQDLWIMYTHRYIMSVVNQEWSPLYQSMHDLIFFSILTVLSLAFLFFVTYKKKLYIASLWLIPFLVFIPYTYLALRNLYFGYLAIIILTGWTLTQISFNKKSKIQIGIIAVVTILIVGSELWIAASNYINATPVWPVAATDFVLKENIQGNMFNQFGDGNYLEYRFYPSRKVFMDGRAEPFFCCEMQDFYNLQINHSKPINVYEPFFNSVFDKYHFSYAILVTKNNPSGKVIANMLEKNPSWFLVYRDDISQIWVKKDGKNTALLNKLTSNQIQQSPSSDTKIFSNIGMDLTFSYPKNFILTQIRDDFISLHDSQQKSTDTDLYIYSTKVPATSTNYKIPFVLPGKLTHEARVPLRGFIATQEIYSDGKTEADFLILRQNNQLIVLRIPQNSDSVADAITDFADTIKTLK